MKTNMSLIKKLIIGMALIGGLNAGIVFASHFGQPNINANPGSREAWNDVIGWVDFGIGEVIVNSANLRGWATSGIGEIGLNCNTTPNGDICTGPAGYWRVRNEVTGALSGWAWNENIGWISFCGNTSSGSGIDGGCPASPTYQVSIDTLTGDFNGWAWNDVVGWISFNCNNGGIGNTCSVSSYRVNTSWRGDPPVTATLTSSTFDTKISGGVALNTIMYQGSQPGGTLVRFQIASSDDPAGPWNYYGPDGTISTYYSPGGPGTQIKITRANHNNVRYFRYLVAITTSGATTPRVDDVIISYSP